MVLKYLQLPFLFDVFQLQSAVNILINESWQMHYQTLHYEGEWSAIPLRSVAGKTDNIIIAPTNDVDYADTFFLTHAPYLQTVLQTFHCPLKAVRLLKLNAGAIIKEHRDADLSFEKGEIRIHIPIFTHPNVEFYLDKERMDIKEGECWYMNFNLPHHIINNSQINRVHLVIDAMVNEWVNDVFNSPGIQTKKLIDDTPKMSPETMKQMIFQLRAMNTPTSNQIADEMTLKLKQE